MDKTFHYNEPLVVWSFPIKITIPQIISSVPAVHGLSLREVNGNACQQCLSNWYYATAATSKIHINFFCYMRYKNETTEFVIHTT